MKRTKFAIAAILIIVVAMVAPASAFITAQNIETKAERMVYIAYDVQETIMGIVTRVEINATAYDMLLAADLDEFFYANVSLCVADGTTLNKTEITVIGDGEAWILLDAANVSLYAGEYEDAIDGAWDSLEIFRDVLRSINGMLIDSGIETGEILDAQLLQEALDRSQDRITQLQDLIADEELLGNLTDAKNLLDEAQAALGLDELEDAKYALIEANSIISYVCRQLRTIAQELNPGRISSYIAHARQSKEQFQERFGHAWDENINVDALAQMFGYANEQDFMDVLWGIIESAENEKMNKEAIKEVIQNLKDLGQMIKNMDKALAQEYVNHGKGQGHGLAGSGKGYGNMGGGNSP